MLTLQELKKISSKELNEEFEKASKDLFKIKFEVHTGSSKASNQIRNLRKYRAKIKTVSKQLGNKEQKEFKAQKEVSEAIGSDAKK